MVEGAEGNIVGISVGGPVGRPVSINVGSSVGLSVGDMDGNVVLSDVGRLVGGVVEGRRDGLRDGEDEGIFVGQIPGIGSVTWLYHLYDYSLEGMVNKDLSFMYPWKNIFWNVHVLVLRGSKVNSL